MAVRYVGFDSAWAGHPKKPGAICAVSREGDEATFHPPLMVGFDEALALLRSWHRPGDLTLLAIDQPTVVPNETGARPAERAIASLMSFSGGGIQPAYRGKAELFGDGAPIWRFLADLGFADDPEAAAKAASGGFVMEVFPALALLSLDPEFLAVHGKGARYNPARARTFRQEAWQAACRAASREARRLALDPLADWCDALDLAAKPRKALQDQLDCMLCCLVAARWHRERETCLMVGDLARGYVVAPVERAARERLMIAAARIGVPAAGGERSWEVKPRG